MPRLRLYHSNPEESAVKADLLRALGHEIVSPKEPCDAVIVDLSRLPSHGREIATALRGSKATRHIPIVFVAGEPEKVAAIRKLLPDAVYTTWQRIPPKFKPVPNPVVPTQMMDRFASRTAAQKLGILPNTSVTVVDPPRDYLRVLGDLPEGAQVEEDSSVISPVTVCFVRDPESLLQILSLGRRIAAKSKFWICWPKGKKAGIKETNIRESAIALGLVDYKICSVDPTWSGLLFAKKK